MRHGTAAQCPHWNKRNVRNSLSTEGDDNLNAAIECLVTSHQCTLVSKLFAIHFTRTIIAVEVISFFREPFEWRKLIKKKTENKFSTKLFGKNTESICAITFKIISQLGGNELWCDATRRRPTTCQIECSHVSIVIGWKHTSQNRNEIFTARKISIVQRQGPMYPRRVLTE